MRWNCPHCRVALETTKDQLAPSWRFSLCPKCLRFGLIRAGFATAVKVDRAPAEEVFIRATCLNVMPQVQPAPAVKNQALKTHAVKTAALPEPLPEVPQRKTPLFPKLVLLGCFLLLAWNGYRYLEITRDIPEDQIVSDHVTSKAMAPERIELGGLVQSRGLGFQIHNGPGEQYPVIGALEQSRKYKVVANDDQWYEIQTGALSAAWVNGEEIIPVIGPVTGPVTAPAN